MTLCALGASAQDSVPQAPIINIKADARLDYQRVWNDGHTDKPNSGFEGKYLDFQIDGQIVDGLTYSWRQRLNKTITDANFFNATDWVWLKYQFGRWNVAGGKEVVKIGGFEYDRSPLDVYSGSVFWANIPCYQIGVSAGYDITPSDRLSLQFCQSPFHTTENRDMYAYNIFWNGRHGIFSSLYSINLVQYAEGKYISYISLGNKFDIDNWSLEFDIMNRAASHQKFFFKDCSIIGDLSWRPHKKWKVHAKATYDVNKSGTGADFTVLDGTELTMVGAGVEFFPLLKNNHSVRLHANVYYAWGNNANAADVMQNKTTVFDIGVKWYMDIFSLKRKPKK